MGVLAPKNDSTNIIIQARTAVFASLLVSAIMLVAALASQERRQVRAISEISHLISIWEALAARPLLSEVLKPTTPAVEPVFYSVEYNQLVDGETVSKTCAIRVDSNQFLIRGLRENTRGQAIQITGTLRDSVYIGNDTGKLRSDRAQPEHFYNFNLSDSERLWEELKLNPSLHLVRSTEIHLRDLRLFAPRGGLSNLRTPLEVTSLSQTEPMTGVTSSLRARNINLPTEFPRLDVQLSGACFIDNEGIPVQTGQQVYTPQPRRASQLPSVAINVASTPIGANLAQQWFEASEPPEEFTIRNTSLSFDEVFSSLDAEAKGLETLPLFELANWLELQADNSTSTVEIFGVKLPSVATKSLGVLIILSMQIFTTQHLSQAHQRLALAAPEDPGAYQPWIFLYAGQMAAITSYALTITPMVVASVVYWLASKDASGDSPLLILSTVGILFSWFVAIEGINNVSLLRKAVLRHTLVPPASE